MLQAKLGQFELFACCKEWGELGHQERINWAEAGRKFCNQIRRNRCDQSVFLPPPAPPPTTRPPRQLSRSTGTQNPCPGGYQYSHRGYWSSKEIDTVHTEGVGNGDACQQICDAQQGCKAFSYYTYADKSCYTYGTTNEPKGGLAKVWRNDWESDPGRSGASYACLKDDQDATLPDVCPSGYAYSHAGHWWHGDRHSSAAWGEEAGSGLTPLACAKKCEEQEWCVSINFYTWGTKLCYLYRAHESYPWAEQVSGRSIACHRRMVTNPTCKVM